VGETKEKNMEYSIVASQTAIAWSRYPADGGGAIIETAGYDLEAAKKFWKAAAKLAPKGIIVRLMGEDDFTHESNAY